MSEQNFITNTQIYYDNNDDEFCATCKNYLPYGSSWHFCKECQKVIGKCCTVKIKENEDSFTNYYCVNCDEKLKTPLSNEIKWCKTLGNKLFEQVTMTVGDEIIGTYKFCPRCNDLKQCQRIGTYIFCSDCAKNLS